MNDLTSHLRILEPHPGIWAFYDGRVAGHRFAPEPNWVDDGALSLGIASYAVVSGTEALVYDTHVSVAHALAVRAALTGLGVTKFTVVLSHWHLDHVAGSAAFPGAEVIANARTAAHLHANRAGIEDGSFNGAPAIMPLVLPTQEFSGQMHLMIGDIRVDLIEANIHSDDATVVWLPGSAEMRQGGQVTRRGSLDELTTELSGTPVPVAALFGWLRGQSSDVPGWQADLSRQPEGRITARRTSPEPTAELRVVVQP